MKIEIQLSEVQELAVKAVASVLRTTPDEAMKVLAFIPVASDYCDVADFREQAENVLTPVLRGELPELHGGEIAGCLPLNTRSRPNVSVELTPEDIAAICHDCASELHCDMGLGHRGVDVDEDDCAAVLNAWRAYSPHYVEDQMASEAKQKGRGFRDRLTPREELEETRAMHDETADRLERLLPYLERATA